MITKTKGGERLDPQLCETCWHYDYDEEADEYFCRMDLDEDDYYRVFATPNGRCPYYQKGDEYYLPRHQ